VVQIHSLAFGLRVIHVNHDDFSRQSAQQQRIGKAGAHVSHSDNSDSITSHGTPCIDSIDKQSCPCSARRKLIHASESENFPRNGMPNAVLFGPEI
jgi:hypothetical protein